MQWLVATAALVLVVVLGLITGIRPGSPAGPTPPWTISGHRCQPSPLDHPNCYVQP